MHKGNVKGTKWPPEEYTPDELMRLIHGCGSERPVQLRNRALVVVLWAGMARIDEALSMLPHDYIGDTGGAGELYIRRGKGCKPRRVALSPDMAPMVEEHVAARVKMGFAGDVPLFCTGTGRKMDKDNVRKWIQGLGVRLGITKPMRCHDLRRSGAMKLMRAGIPIGIISRAMGHSSVSTTARYLTTTGDMEVLEAMKGMTWAA